MVWNAAPQAMAQLFCRKGITIFAKNRKGREIGLTGKEKRERMSGD